MEINTNILLAKIIHKDL